MLEQLAKSTLLVRAAPDSAPPPQWQYLFVEPRLAPAGVIDSLVLFSVDASPERLNLSAVLMGMAFESAEQFESGARFFETEYAGERIDQANKRVSGDHIGCLAAFIGRALQSLHLGNNCISASFHPVSRIRPLDCHQKIDHGSEKLHPVWQTFMSITDELAADSWAMRWAKPLAAKFFPERPADAAQSLSILFGLIDMIRSSDADNLYRDEYAAKCMLAMKDLAPRDCAAVNEAAVLRMFDRIRELFTRG